jgi:type VI secretion system (T6SS) effector TldE1-like protein
MGSILARAGLRPVLIGLAALLVGFSVEWPKRLDGSANPESLARSVGGSTTVAKRSPMLASLASLPSRGVEINSGTGHAAHDAQPSSFADRFAAVFWYYGDDDDVVRHQVSTEQADDEADEAPPPRRAHDDSKTAVYVIAEHTVYMPNGERLEAHSGLGHRTDDPQYIKVKMRGPTPPNVYDLTLRKSMFHGVRAIRLNPVDENRMFGRDGMLAHSYMLRGSKGQSNGCVVFRDYPAFLHAFQRGEVDRLVVVERIEDAPETPRNIGTANLNHHAKRKLRHVASR